MSFRKVKGRGIPEWLYTRHLKNSVQFWIRVRTVGLQLNENLSKLPGVDGQRSAIDAGRELLADRQKPKIDNIPQAVLRMESVCDDVVGLKRGKAKRTHARNESISRVHIKPYMNLYCAYAKDFNAATFDHYKTFKRAEDPNITLFGHWKFFVGLSTHLYKKGIIRERLKFSFNEETEDFRKPGQVIPNDQLQLILKHSTAIWRDRIYIQRYTGMRPGEVSNLQKDRVDLSTGRISLRKGDTKTRKARSFLVRSPIVMEILRRRAQSPNTPFFFPGRDDPQKPIDGSLKYWHRAIRMANEELEANGKNPMPDDYTPHDLRHTFLTHEFKKPGAKIALTCFMAGLTLEEAQKTYLHFTAEDTAEIADELAKESLALGGTQ